MDASRLQRAYVPLFTKLLFLLFTLPALASPAPPAADSVPDTFGTGGHSTCTNPIVRKEW